MKLTEQQLRILINEIIVEGRKKKPTEDEAVKQIEDAYKTIMRYHMYVADYLDDLSKDIAESAGDPGEGAELEELAEYLENFYAPEGDIEHLSRVVKAAKKAIKSRAKSDARAAKANDARGHARRTAPMRFKGGRPVPPRGSRPKPPPFED